MIKDYIAVLKPPITADDIHASFGPKSFLDFLEEKQS
jgi:hypothetical protein